MPKKEDFSAFVVVNGKVLKTDQDTCHACGKHGFDDLGFCQACGARNCLKCGFLAEDCKCELARREIKLKNKDGEEKVAMIADFSGLTKAWNNFERMYEEEYFEKE